MLTPEQIARLNPEQLVIAEKWDREREARKNLLDKLEAAQKALDFVAYGNLLKELTSEELNPEQCEHERSLWSSCASCDEIEQLLHPEFYDENGERLEDEEIEKILLSKE